MQRGSELEWTCLDADGALEAAAMTAQSPVKAVFAGTVGSEQM
ncbi:hypothetical protein [Dyella tabacisoli]|nr:hypothetical protein [Dyella tabacisoli]